jgi:hypothetical protein
VKVGATRYLLMVPTASTKSACSWTAGRGPYQRLARIRRSERDRSTTDFSLSNDRVTIVNPTSTASTIPGYLGYAD